MTGSTSEDNALLQNLIDHLPKAMVYIIRGKLFLNLKAEIQTGYKTGDFNDLNDWFRVVYKDQASFVRDLYLKDKKAGFKVPARVPFLRKDGVSRIMDFHATAHNDIEVWILDDVTEKLIAEERFTSLFTYSNNAHLLFSEDDGIIDCNPAAVSLLKASSKEELLKCHPAQFSPEYQPCGMKSFDKKMIMDSLAREKGFHRFEWIHRKMDGEDFPVEVTLTPIIVTNRQMHLVVWHDLTEYKLSQKELESERVKLFNATKMASLGEMASGVAHEINNPLTVILNKASQIKNHISLHEIDKNYITSAADKIIITVDRISKIIKGLTHFSRDASEDDKHPVLVINIINEVLDLCKARFASNGVNVKINVKETGQLSTLSVFGNSIQVQQVLLNLLNNAYDAISLLKDPWVEIGLEQFDPDTVDIFVMDSGPGIPTEIREKIMNPFFTTKEVGKGTGLGLSISQGIIKSHQGELFLCPKSSQTKFVIRLPIHN